MKKIILILLFFITVINAQTVNNVVIYRGDSKTFTFLISGDYTAKALSFVVKKDISVLTPRLIEKNSSDGSILMSYSNLKTNITVSLIKSETWGLTAGNYVFDIEATDPANSNYTETITRGAFTIIGDVKTPYDGTNLIQNAKRYIPVDTTGMREGYYVKRSGNTFITGNINIDTTLLKSHIANTSNPHAVTKTQLGLSNADNTSDANKPISSATQTALNLKMNISDSLNYVTQFYLNQYYYNKISVNGFLGAKADTGNVYNRATVNNLLSIKQNSLGFTPENAANKSHVNGYASLDATGKIPLSELPSGLPVDTNKITTRYYLGQNHFTKTETNNFLSNKADTTFSKNPANIAQNASYRFVTDTQINNLSTAYNNTHTHSNKSLLDSNDVAFTLSLKGKINQSFNHISLTNNPHNVTASQVGKSLAQWNANKIQGYSWTVNTPTNGYIPVWRDSVFVYEQKPISSGNPAWGDITGSLSGQTDLSNALNAKLALSDSINKYYTQYSIGQNFYNKTSVNNLLSSKVSFSDSTVKYITPLQLNNLLANKLNLSDSTVKYITPTQLNLHYTKTEINNLLNNKIALSDSNTFTGYIKKYYLNSLLSGKQNSLGYTPAKDDSVYHKWQFPSLFDTRLGTKTTDNLSQGTTNKYYASSLFNTDFASKTTDNLTEGSTNKYYTDTRARGAISSTVTGLTYTSGTGILSLTSGYLIPTTTQGTNWTTAYTNNHTHSNKTKLDSLTTANANVLNNIQSTNITTWNNKQIGSSNLTSVTNLSYSSLSLVKMNAANTFSLLVTPNDSTKILDGAGNYSKIQFRLPHAYTVSGEIKVPSGDTDFINGFFVPVPTGQTVKIVSCRYIINSGTSATVKLQKNGSDITGFTGISVTTTAASTTPTSVSLADNDKINLVVTAVSGTPKNMSFTIFLEYTTY